ncbi:succinate dehydrogenase, cytochrome b556 subunit [Anaplasmataceae bacterium AB001_6]|nr:succinate dehydrogenase, cytochrome b556 subunit [Anaplasmataceae bacterium AB001_6]
MFNKLSVLSPHLQVYKFPLAVVCSILHRFSGLFLFFYSVLFLNWYFFFLFYPDSFIFSLFSYFSQGWMFLLLSLGLIFSVTYHSLNGIRHLLWDMRFFISLRSIKISSFIVIFFAFLLSAYLIFLFLY